MNSSTKVWEKIYNEKKENKIINWNYLIKEWQIKQQSAVTKQHCYKSSVN